MLIFKRRQNLHKRKHLKKAQTSFFVIIGVFMFIAMLIGFVIYNNIKAKKVEEEAKKTADLSLQAEEIEKFVNECIRKASFEGLKKLGQTGGYLELPSIINFKGTSYWHLDQVNIQPFLNQTQERLLEHINANVPKCVDDEKIKQLGFSAEKGELKTSIEFGAADITIKTNYPIKLSQQDFTKEFSEFFNTFDIRYRAVFEAATEINEKTFDADFDEKEPLKKLDYLKSLDFDVSYKNPETDIVAFTITDKKSITPENKNYEFSFAAKLGRSELKRVTDLQNRSASVSTPLPYTIFSVDKKAQLDINSGTTISKDGKDVEFISVQQSYPSEAITKDVPTYKRNKDVVQKQDIKYIVTNPVYSFEPTGLLFNNFQRLTLYYDKETDDSKGMGILMGKNGFWVPITSKHDSINKKVYTGILGFTEFTAVACSAQEAKETIAENLFEPNAGCYISLTLTIIALIVAVVLIFAGPVIFTGAGFVAGSGGVASTGPTLGVIGAKLASFVGAVGATGISVGTATAIGIAVVGLSVLSTVGTILGATTDTFYGTSPDNCETFYPTCDQTISVEVGGDAEEGQCVPKEGSQRVAAGAPINVCAQVESCGNFLEKMICKSCSQKCTAKFN
ncbi:hypothetical protein HYX07_05565 [Candidatus Woesearchaeota archaeon]|nr:hypothetical protein [Candidatus Woesearchaeota archaeon]